MATRTFATKSNRILSSSWPREMDRQAWYKQGIVGGREKTITGAESLRETRTTGMLTSSSTKQSGARKSSNTPSSSWRSLMMVKLGEPERNYFGKEDWKNSNDAQNMKDVKGRLDNSRNCRPIFVSLLSIDGRWPLGVERKRRRQCALLEARLQQLRKT